MGKMETEIKRDKRQERPETRAYAYPRYSNGAGGSGSSSLMPGMPTFGGLATTKSSGSVGVVSRSITTPHNFYRAKGMNEYGEEEDEDAHNMTVHNSSEQYCTCLSG